MKKNKQLLDLSKYQAYDRIVQTVFMGLAAVFVFGYCIQTTKFTAYFGGTLSDFALKMMTIAALVRGIFAFGRHRREVLSACGLGLILFIFYHFNPAPDPMIRFLGVMALGNIGMDYRRFLKMHVFIVGITVLTAVIASFAGTIPNLVYLKDGVTVRDSFGIIYPTDFASYLFFILLFFWIAWNKIPGWVSLLISIPFLITVCHFAVSDTCTLCGIGFVLIAALLPLFEKHVIKDGKLTWMKKLVNALLVLAFLLLAAMTFALIAAYGREVRRGQTTGFAIRFDSWITHRLGLAYYSIREHGITLFGSLLKQQGNGGLNFKMAGYDFVDSSYPLILLKYGWPMFLVICFLWVRTAWIAVKRKDYRLAFGMGLIAIHSFMEHHFPEGNYNLILFMPFALYQDCEPADESIFGTLKQRDKRKNVLLIGGVLLFIALLFPLWLAAIRTVCGAERISGDGIEIPFVVGMVLASVFAIAGIVTGALEVRKAKRIALLSAGLSLLVIEAVILFEWTGKAQRTADTLWEKDSVVIETIDREMKGRLYATEFPLFYAKHVSHARLGILTGDDLARRKNVTLITARGNEYYALIKKGFYYAAISEDTAVYSNEQAVIEKLRQLGMQPKPYFDEIRYVELPTNVAPAQNLRKGFYEVTYRLSVTEGEEKPVNVAEMTIVGNRGYEIIAKEHVPATAMDEDGNVIWKICIDLKDDMPGMMFYVLGEDGCRVDVKEVSYQMTK